MVEMSDADDSVDSTEDSFDYSADEASCVTDCENWECAE